MKRTQQSVILAGLLALSLAACSYLPWKNTSGTTPASSASPTTSSRSNDAAPAVNSTAGGAGSEKTSAGGNGPSGQN